MVVSWVGRGRRNRQVPAGLHTFPASLAPWSSARRVVGLPRARGTDKPPAYRGLGAGQAGGGSASHFGAGARQLAISPSSTSASAPKIIPRACSGRMNPWLVMVVMCAASPE